MAKVLIVEDEVSIAKMYSFKLKQAGYDVRTAYDGKEGLLTAGKYRPDLILLDLLMPIMAGDEMLQELRKKEWGSNVRVIILTNISKSEAPSKFRFMNIDRYIVKAHYTPSQVVKIVGETLRQKRGAI